MKSISHFFERHMKTRIALQLVLDGLPFGMFLYMIVIGILELDNVIISPGWWDMLAMSFIYVMFFGGGMVLFILAIWLRSRAKAAFERYAWCRGMSFLLRVLSFIPAVLSLGMFVSIIATYFLTR